jgi:transcriptional regulator GlxA family with amidase domain
MPTAARPGRHSRQKVANHVLTVFPHGLPPLHDDSGVFVSQASTSILDATTRLIELMAQPGDAELIAPLVVDEILIRLLRSPVGVRVAQVGFADSGVFGVAKAVSWLRDNFSQPLKVEELARLANMSVSTFHQHFKSVTSKVRCSTRKSCACRRPGASCFPR